MSSSPVLDACDSHNVLRSFFLRAPQSFSTLQSLFLNVLFSLADGVVRAVKRLAEQKGYLEYLRLDGVCNINSVHLDVLKSLLAYYALRNAPQPLFFSYWCSLDFNTDDRRPIDVDVCPKCRNVGMVFDCTREDCRIMKGHWGQCRGCFFCIARCKECGGCLDEEAWSLALCAGCWLQLPKCSTCNRPCCREDMNIQGASSSGFVCGQCRFKDGL